MMLDPNNALVVLNQNIRSMRQNFNLLLSDLESARLFPDIMVLTETWIGRDELNLYKIEGYNMFAKCNEGYRAGGTVVFVRDCYQCSGVRERDDIQSADVLQLDVTVDDLERFTLIAVYRLHSSLRSVFINDVDSMLSGLEGRNIVFVGDMNLDILSNSIDTDSYLSLLSSKGMDSLVNEPTRIKGSSSTCIDHVFVRFINRHGSEYDLKSNVYHYNITDHSTVVFSVHFCKHIKQANEEFYSKVDTEKLAVELGNVDWSDVYNHKSVSDAFQCFLDVLDVSLSNCKYSVRVSKCVNKLKPWTTDRLLIRLKKRKQIYKLLMRNPNNAKYKKYYTNFRNRLNFDIKNAKESYYKNKFENSSSDIKSQWKVVNSLIGESRKRCNINEIIVEDGVVSDCFRIANEFNSHFLNAPNALRLQVNNSYFNQVLEYNDIFAPRINCKMSFFMKPTTTGEVLSIIHNLKHNKAPGFDGVGSTVVKQIAPSIINVLTYLYNFSLSTGEFPKCLKKAVVIPIFKRGDCRQPNCFRPISLLSVFSKILEKIVKTQLVTFLNRSKFFSNNQFGFREGFSTEDALLTFVESVYDPINNSKKVSALFIDITKAFDTVDHDILYDKLWLAGIRGLPLNWFSSYLSERVQRVSIAGTLGNLGKVECGVPQGSVLGPILFLIYMNDLCNGRFNGRLVAFADDTAFIYENNNLHTLYSEMMRDLYYLRLWFDKNYMILSEKSKYMIFGLRKEVKFALPLKFHEFQCINSGDIRCDCIEIEEVSSIKYLGLVIDNHLSWKEHVVKLKKELYNNLRKFYLLKQLCRSGKVLVSVYHALIGSRLCYGITCWGGTYSSTIYPVVILQKRFMRLISAKDRLDHTWPIFINLKTLPLRHLYIFKVLKMFFIRSSAFSVDREAGYNLRRVPAAYVPKSHFTSHQMFYSSVAPRLFNLINSKIENFSTLGQFLTKLKIWLLLQENADELLGCVK